MTQARRNGAAAAAAASIDSYSTATVGTPGAEDAPDLAETVFPRLSVERRVLGNITDEVDVIRVGPRNTLAAITYALMTDVFTTNPPEGQPRLDIGGKSTEQVAQEVLDMLDALADAGLVEQRDDDSYAVTEAGQAELMG